MCVCVYECDKCALYFYDYFYSKYFVYIFISISLLLQYSRVFLTLRLRLLRISRFGLLN